MVVAADHVGDVHQRIVDGDHVVVDGDTFDVAIFVTGGGTDNDRIANRLGGEFHLTPDQVVKPERVIFDFQADSKGLVRGKLLIDLFRGEGAALSRVDLRAVFGGGLAALLFQLFRSAEARIGFAFAQQLLGVLGVDIQPLRLAVGTVAAGFRGGPVGIGKRSFIPVEAEPAQVLNELFLVAGFGALHVGVFNAEDEIAAHAPGE